jgi:hypothetical protein
MVVAKSLRGPYLDCRGGRAHAPTSLGNDFGVTSNNTEHVRHQKEQCT